MKAINIKWDTDEEERDLPNEMEILDDLEEDEIADYLSNKNGFIFQNDGEEGTMVAAKKIESVIENKNYSSIEEEMP